MNMIFETALDVEFAEKLLASHDRVPEGNELWGVIERSYQWDSGAGTTYSVESVHEDPEIAESIARHYNETEGCETYLVDGDEGSGVYSSLVFYPAQVALKGVRVVRQVAVTQVVATFRTTA